MAGFIYISLFFPEYRIQDGPAVCAYRLHQHRRSHYADAFNVAQVLNWFFKMVPDVGVHLPALMILMFCFAGEAGYNLFFQ